MRLGIRVAPRAASQIREAADWWLANRPKAPLAFEEDLEKAFDLIVTLPGAGQRVRHTHIQDLRRAFLGRAGYYLSYAVNSDDEVVSVLALWHARRARHPNLD